jgi:hypothetical protein
MRDTMTEIECALITITDAFHNLYGSLFNEVASEVSTNIKVLKDIFVQNGLTEGKNNLTLAKKGKDEYDGQN